MLKLYGRNPIDTSKLLISRLQKQSDAQSLLKSKIELNILFITLNQILLNRQTLLDLKLWLNDLQIRVEYQEAFFFLLQVFSLIQEHTVYVNIFLLNLSYLPEKSNTKFYKMYHHFT